MSRSTRLYLARHGETQWNVEKRIQGQQDSKLTALGKSQAEALAAKASSLNISLVFSSTLNRAIETAEVTAKSLNIKHLTHNGLDERHFGLWQGKLLSDLTRSNFYDDIFHRVNEHSAPEGESGTMARDRFTKALTQILENHSNESCLIISHGDVLRCFLSMLDKPLVGDAYSEFSNGCLLSVDYNHQNKSFSLV